MRAKKDIIIVVLSIITIAILAFAYYQNGQITKYKALAEQHSNAAAAARMDAEKQRDIAVETLKRAQQLTNELEAAVKMASQQALK